MKQYFLTLILFFCIYSYSQETPKDSGIKKEKIAYTRVEFSIPLSVNEYYGENDQPWFLPDGIIGRVGIGINANNWIRIGANFGIDWKASECEVMAPFYGSIEINPKVLNDLRIFIEPGYGRDMIFGETGFSNEFKKISFGIENGKDDFGVFIEMCEYGYRKNYDNIVGNVSIGFKAKF